MVNVTDGQLASVVHRYLATHREDLEVRSFAMLMHLRDCYDHIDSTGCRLSHVFDARSYLDKETENGSV